MTRARWALVAALALAGCAEKLPPIAAPLRYDPVPPAPDAPFRAQPPAAPPPEIAPPIPFASTTLPSGMRVVLLERHDLPVVSVRLVFARGAADVRGFQPEAVPFLGDVLFETGTIDRPAIAVEEAFTQAGARRTVSFGSDGCMLSIRAPSASLGVALESLASWALRPRFSAAVINGVRSRWSRRLVSLRSEASAAARVNGWAAVFGLGSPYVFPAPNSWSAISWLQVSDLENLHAQIVRPEHATLVVAGDVTLADLSAIAARSFGAAEPRAVPAAPRSAALPATVPASARVVLVDRRDQPMAHAYVVARGPSDTSIDAEVLAILGDMFGGQSSRLHDELREEIGSTYVFGTQLTRNRLASAIAIGGPFEAGKVARSLRAVLQAIEAARAGRIDPAAFETSRTRLVAHFRARTATVEGLSDLAAHAIRIDAPIESALTYPERVGRITLADVTRVASSHLASGALRVVVVGDARDVESELAQLGMGPVERRDGNGQIAR